MGKVSLYLDKRSTPSVKMLLSYKRKTLLFSMHIVLNSVEQWTGDENNPIICHPLARQYNQLIRLKLALATDVLYTLESQRGDDLTIEEIKSAIISRVDPAKAEAEKQKEEQKELNRSGVLAHYMKVMANYEGRTWEIYETTLRRLREYAEDTHGRASAEDYASISQGGLPSDKAQQYLQRLRFEDITEKWLDGWRDSMSDTKGLATQSIYLRTFRHICKDAFDYDLTNSYVWKRYKIPKAEGDVHPLTEDQFCSFFKNAAPAWCEQYRQMAWFCFCTIGMNIVDVHKLNWSQITEGYLRYKRSKTGRKYCIKLEPEALQIIASIGNKPEADRKVFQWAERYKRHGDYSQHLNDGLRAIVPNIHFYMFRHTWAQFAVRAGVSMDTIARCLGHGKRTVTDVYVEVDQSEINIANRKVIDYALKVIG